MARGAAASGPAARDDSEAPALRGAVGAAVTGPFGAQISLLMHQENLTVPRGATLTTNGSRVWGTLAEVARTLRLVWEEFFRKLLPFGVDSAGLVMAICCGKLTVAAMVPAGVQAAKSAKATSQLRDAVMRAWPAVIVVIGEVHPREATMQEELLRLGACGAPHVARGVDIRYVGDGAGGGDCTRRWSS